MLCTIPKTVSRYATHVMYVAGCVLFGMGHKILQHPIMGLNWDQDCTQPDSMDQEAGDHVLDPGAAP